MCEDCIYGSVVGGFPVCRLTGKYPHIECELYKQDPNCIDNLFVVDKEAWERYPTWNK